MTAEQVVAVVADIVGSRHLADRDAAQERIHAAWAQADEQVRPVRGGWATVGDEFQAVYAGWQDAVRATLRVALALPEDVVLRYGMGAGERRRVRAPSGEEPVEDGTAWYRAREAVELSAARAEGLSSAFLGPDPELALAVDAQLRLRDHVVGRLKSRERRLARLLVSGATQAEAARAERITQSAVSQAVARSGIDRLLAVDAALAGGGAGPSGERS